MKPHEIEAESFRIIEELVDWRKYFTESQWPVARRMIHACGDIQIAESIRISDKAVQAGINALGLNTPLVCDVQMLKSGLSKVARAGRDVHCFINDPAIAEDALRTGETRARRAMFHAAGLYPEAVYLIGNAPTALIALMELVKAGKMAPALVVGVPVGFVMAAESKEWLSQTPLNYITNLGYKGGSPMTVAAFNALAAMK